MNPNPQVLYRGTEHERSLVKGLIEKGIFADLIYHDLYIPLTENEYAQIDILIITRVGIIIVEDKDYSGWIFGKGTDSKWTQMLCYGEVKNRFYNPVKQNLRHIAVLKQSLSRLADVPYFSIITFGRKCELRKISDIPAGTFICYSHQLKDIIDRIKENNPSIDYGNCDQDLIELLTFESNGANPRIVRLHKDNMKKKELEWSSNINQDSNDAI